MSIPFKYQQALELPKVLAMLAEETTCFAAHERALALQPATELSAVTRSMQYTADANMLTNRYGTPSARNIRDCTLTLDRARLGAQLTIPELLAVLHLVQTFRTLQSWKRQSEDTQSALDYLFTCVHTFRDIEDALKNAILAEDAIADTASPELANIRRKIRAAEQRVRSQLDGMIRSATYQKYLQEPIVTIRDGRFVVPVKSEYRSEIKGLVHDTSSSGASVFIEPMSVVEANNEIKMLEGQEKQEIDRILLELSALVGSRAEELSMSYDAVVELDLYFAKSRLADKMRASVPSITDDQRITLVKARHPLIDSEKIVPVDITLGVDFDTLVITGPNTGGKTVLLKTVGLLTLMVMCGLMIPAADGSSVSVFGQVLADIGDEQSIEQSLSTFSGHMTNIVSILQHTDARSLVLVDELGAGTDPVEGAALAISIIEQLRAQGAKVLATTHYPEIKLYALQTKGVVNGSCEFDVQTLRPTYRLLIGVPGRSNAFAISERLGLDAQIIAHAKGLISNENRQFEDVVTQLDAARQELETERTQAHMLTLQAERMRAEAEEFRVRLEREKEQEIERAREKARSMVEQVKFQAEQLMDEIDELRKQKEATDFFDRAAKAKQSYRSNLRRLYETADPITGRTPDGYQLPRALKRGDSVLILDLNKEGTVISDQDKDGMVMVQAGIIKTKVAAEGLKLLDKSDRKVTVNNRRVSFQKSESAATRKASTEVDIRGMNVDEALPVLARFIDGCVLSNIKAITIIHGKGTGALRAGVHQYLRKHPSIRSFRLGLYGEGESGVTIAELK